MGVCKVNIINKDIRYSSSFFVVPGNRPALLGMPDCERLQLLSIKCQTMSNTSKLKCINEQIKQDMSKLNKYFKIDPYPNHKINTEKD